MLITGKNYKLLILKLLLSVAMLVLAGFLVHKNFIKKKRFLYIPPPKFDTQYLYSKFDLDILENKVFKELKEVDKIDKSSIKDADIGRENPFLKF